MINAAPGMTGESFAARLQTLRVLPVVMLDHPSTGVDVATALRSGGLGCIEITLRTEGALEAISAVAQALPDMLVGAGAVMRPQQVREAIAAGAQFVASPVADPAVIRRARQIGVPMIPGITRHSDAIAVAREGLRLAKLSLAADDDGRAEIQEYARMFYELQLIPTGAVGPEKIAAYLREPSVLAVATTRTTPIGAGGVQIAGLAALASRSAARAFDRDNDVDGSGRAGGATADG
jgi:2-dehydro-3-deoxyphosphogluconate aldolase/(4S)-4-hydroxy-2-oxoglutarate aldolase